MFCANIPEQQRSCKICLKSRLFGQKLSLKWFKSQTCLVPPALQKNHSAHQGQSGLEKWSADHRMGLHYCSDPSYKLVSTPDQRMGGHIYEDLMSLDEAWRMQGRQQVTGRQGVQQLGRQDTRTGDSVRSILPRILKIFYLETCSGQTWLSSTQSLSI